MIIDTAKSAREFVRAYARHSGAQRAYRMAAESQRSCATLSGPNVVQAARHTAAANVLDRAADAVSRP